MHKGNERKASKQTLEERLQTALDGLLKNQIELIQVCNEIKTARSANQKAPRASHERTHINRISSTP